jgi:putative transposase
MKSSHAKIGIGRLCMLFGKTRHAFYDKSWHEHSREQAGWLALEMVAQIRREIPRIGTAKLYHMIKAPLQTHGIKMGRDALHNLLADHGLMVKVKKRRIKTTDSNHRFRRYPNLIKELIAGESEQGCVADITYIQIKDDFNYLSLITDVYSKQIMGYCLHPTLEAEGSLIALRMALEKRTKGHLAMIHHSDRGVQYCCYDYVQLLQGEQIQISMTENGDPYENPVAERVNGILKYDFDLGRIFSSTEQAQQAIEQSIRAYNELRPHMSCDFLTPSQAHQVTGPLKKRWKPKVYSKPLQTL